MRKSSTTSSPTTNNTRWLRAAQIEALATYWYLRLVEGTPHILDLYETIYESKSHFRSAIGIDTPEIKDFLLDEGQDALFDKIRTDNAFVKSHKLETLRESLLLDYPSYILALTMGAGKTALIAAIIATEFAMAMEYETLDGDIPVTHLPAIASQIEAHTSHYTTETEEIEIALALVKPEGFDLSTAPDGTTCYTARISYPKSREHLLRHFKDFVHDNSHGFSFHYSPYNFDSNPEAEYFENLLKQCDTRPDEVEDFFFTGALTDSKKTDFSVEYQDVDGKWRAYTPDFVIRRKDGRCLIVEIKKDDPTIRADIERIENNGIAHTTEGRKYLALKRWEKLDPDRLRYEMKYAAADGLPLSVQDDIAEYITTTAIPSNSTSME